MSEKLSSIKVPDQLAPLITDDMREVLDKWNTKPLSEVLANFPEPTEFEINGRLSRATILPALSAEKSDTTVVLGMEHQQDLTKAHKARYRFMQELIAPEHDIVIFPNNSIRSSNYSFTSKDRETLESGDFTPLSQIHSRMLTALGVGRLGITAYSLDARVLMGLAGLGDHNIAAINSDETPSKEQRSTKELQKDFLKSGGWGAQRSAIKDANVRAVLQAYRSDRLAIDYIRFGIAALVNKDNAALKAAMGDSVTPDMTRALDVNPNMTIKLGRIAGSYLTDLSDSETQAAITQNTDRVRTVEYTGEATYGHTTSNNAVAHALMVLDGLGKVLGK